MSNYTAHALYEGWVSHRRLKPLHHAFRYRMTWVFLNLDQLDQAFAGRWLWSCHRPAVAWLRRGDHLGDAEMPLAEATRQLVRARGINADGPICLLTQLRYWGFVMNPVSFYFCYAGDSQQLRAIVAEVHNTPWGERHCYVLQVEQSGAEATWLEKQFHVSPFMPIDQQYRWRVATPGQSLHLRIANFEQGQQHFSATLRLRRRPWSTWELHRALWMYPLMTQRIFAAIYWQALRLWWKGATYYPHPGPLPEPEPDLEMIEQEPCKCGDLG